MEDRGKVNSCGQVGQFQHQGTGMIALSWQDKGKKPTNFLTNVQDDVNEDAAPSIKFLWEPSEASNSTKAKLLLEKVCILALGRLCNSCRCDFLSMVSFLKSKPNANVADPMAIHMARVSDMTEEISLTEEEFSSTEEETEEIEQQPEIVEEMEVI